MVGIRSLICPKIELFDPSATTSPGDRAAIHDLIVQPAAPWFSDVERRHLEVALSGEFGAAARDRFWIAWIDGQPVANVYIDTAERARDRTVGLRDHCPRLSRPRVSADCCSARPWPISLLRAAPACTWRPRIRRPIACMSVAAFEIIRGMSCDSWRRPAIGKSSTEPISRMLDLPESGVRTGVTRLGSRSLYVTPHRWFVRDYAERLYNHPIISQTRCASILPALMINTTERPARGNLLRAGCGCWRIRPGVWCGGHRYAIGPQRGGARARSLTSWWRLTTWARRGTCGGPAGRHPVGRRGLRAVFVAGCDHEKMDILVQAGFRLEATLAGQLKAGRERFDLHGYGLPFDMKDDDG